MKKSLIITDISSEIKKEDTPAMVAEESIEGFVLTSLDSFEGSFNSSKEMIVEWFNRTKKCPNYVITRNGDVFKLTKDDQSARLLSNNTSFSHEASLKWPKDCPQYEIESKDGISQIDTKLVSVGLECYTNTNGKPTMVQEQSLRLLLAHYIQNLQNAATIYNESAFPRAKNAKENAGHRYFKDKIVELSVLLSKADKLSNEIIVELFLQSSSN